MIRGLVPSDCKHCGHPVEAHEAAECWWDLFSGGESWDPIDQCDCDAYEPLGLALVGA